MELVKNRVSAYSPIKLLSEDRLDVILKFLFIYSYLDNKETYDFYREQYIKMQMQRCGWHDVNRFINLIESFKKHGYIPYHAIPVSGNLDILEGSHRLACSLFFDTNIYITQGTPYPYNDYSKKWFKSNGFSLDLIDKMIETFLEFKRKINHININSSYGIVIIWEPSFEYINEIIYIISKETSIESISLLKLHEDVETSLWEIYGENGILKKQIIEKSKIFKKKRNFVLLRVFDKNMNKPFEYPILLGIKNKIRKRLSPLINNYIFDIIIHCSDSEEESINIFRKTLSWHSNKTIIDTLGVYQCV